MEQTTREVITRPLLQKQLANLHKASTLMSLVLFVFFCILLLPLGIAMAKEGLPPHQPSIIGGFFVVVGILMALGPVIPLVVIIRNLIELRRIARGEFDVILCNLSYKDEELVYQGRRTPHLVEMLYFENDLKTSTTHTTYQLADKGDPFYLVLSRKKTSAILLHFAAERYAFKE